MKDHPIKGISLMIFAVFLIMVMNSFSKLASGNHNAIELVFWRGVFALPVILIIIAYRRDFSLFKTTRPKDQLIRGTAGSIGMGLMFWAYSLMPMANTVAILFTAGLMTTTVSAIWLKEKVGPFRWAAVVIGFLGALIAATPETGDEWNKEGVLVALLAAFVSGAVVSTMLRSLGKTERALTTVFYFICISIVITSPFVISNGTFPQLNTLPILIGCGVAGGISLICKTQAYRHAEASLLSPIYYTTIIWGVLFGWMIWDEIPTMKVMIGATIIITANIVIIWREKKNQDDLKQIKPCLSNNTNCFLCSRILNQISLFLV